MPGQKQPIHTRLTDIQIMFIDRETRSQAGRSTPQLYALGIINQIGSCDKVAYQQHVDGAIARWSCSDGEKWMVELGCVIPLHTLQTIERKWRPRGSSNTPFASPTFMHLVVLRQIYLKTLIFLSPKLLCPTTIWTLYCLFHTHRCLGTVSIKSR